MPATAIAQPAHAPRFVYAFGGPRTDGDATMRNLLGGKGANLAEMARLGLPVPPGFTLTTEVCTAFYAGNRAYPDGLQDEVAAALAALESAMGARFGDAANPLLVSVRSGARASMPGMMDTVLNLGLTDATAEGLAQRSGDARFAWDSYRRFIQMYGNVVMGVPHHAFEDILDGYKRHARISQDTAITAQAWQDIIRDYKDLVQREAGRPFPQDPHEQLWGAIGAVFDSWMTPRAVTYRRLHDIPAAWGTAVNVQAMVFGNMGDDSATGVAFTRDPSTGENVFYGEYLINAQGEDVVAGIRTPEPIDAMGETLPEVYAQLCVVREQLERHFRDVQDLEFTVQQGRLFLLQTRTGKRSARAAVRIAVDMAGDGLITREEAVLRVDPASLDQLLHPTLDPAAPRDVVTRGLPASPGAACGAIVFTSEAAQDRHAEGLDVILCRQETSPEDIHGMHAAVGIVTARGGMTSHAAVVARGMGKPCVAGAGALHIDYAQRSITVGPRTLREGDTITIDGSTGEIFAGAIPTVQPDLSESFRTLMSWGDAARRLAVRTNAETPEDVQTARDFGAQGIGLARTEHMFFDPERIQAVREMIFAESAQGRADALGRLLPAQRTDFVAIFSIMEGLPVTIRLLDPPLHEFLPHAPDDIAAFAAAVHLPEETVHKRLAALHEANPMLGHRGCRLGITCPEIYEMQVRAVLEAALEVPGTQPEIMIPLISSRAEMEHMRALVERVAEAVFTEKRKRIEFLIGTMIELPRAALRAGEVAEGAEFFSFGTNDLTQTTFGMSRDDAASFLPAYMEGNLLERDPFASLDVDGVGELVRLAAERGRSTRPGLKLGICGEHGGDPATIAFCEAVGLDYVSCSPYRVPIARLAAAQAALRAEQHKRG